MVIWMKIHKEKKTYIGPNWQKEHFTTEDPKKEQKAAHAAQR